MSTDDVTLRMRTRADASVEMTSLSRRWLADGRGLHSSVSSLLFIIIDYIIKPIIIVDLINNNHNNIKYKLKRLFQYFMLCIEAYIYHIIYFFLSHSDFFHRSYNVFKCCYLFQNVYRALKQCLQNYKIEYINKQKILNTGRF